MFARVTEPTFVADGVVRLGTELVNFHLVEESGRVTVVDAGLPAYRDQLERGLKLLGRARDDIAAVVFTHAHNDHLGFASELGVPAHIHAEERTPAAKREASLLRYLRHPHTWKLIGHFATSGGKPKRPRDMRTFVGGETLDVPGHPRVVHTPGHTPGHVCFWFESRGVLAVGDLFCTLNPLTGTRGPQLLPRALNLSSPTMLESLSRIEGLPASTIVFGHGEPWTSSASEAVHRTRTAGWT